MYRHKKTHYNLFLIKRSCAAFVVALFTVGLLGVPAYAHKVSVFAWVEGDMVHTQSKFSGGRRVKNAPVEIYDAGGKKLLEGLTDERGKFSFKSPGKGPLRIVLTAAMGHKAHWTLSAEELSGCGGTTETIVSAAPPGKSVPPAAETSVSSTLTVRTADIQAAVERALDKKLKPVVELLVEAKNPDPSFRDVLGGLGYILGLVGLGAYLNYRRKIGRGASS